MANIRSFKELKEILAMLTDMASHPEQWTIR